MSDYITIPLADNPGRPFSSRFAGASTGGGVVADDAGGGASAAVPVLTATGEGAGATVTVTKGEGSTIAEAVITIVAAGDGYKVGDEVTIAALTSPTTHTTWTATIYHTIVADDLQTSEGSSTDPRRMIPTDRVCCVKLSSDTQATIETNIWDENGAFYKWNVVVDVTPATTSAHLAADISDAILAASTRPNSQPSVDFYNSAECLAVDYTAGGD